MKSKSKFPDEVRQYIEANYKGVSPTEMSKRIRTEFNFCMSPLQMRTYYGNHKLNSGLTKLRYKPYETKPVGTESFYRDYWFVKIAEPNKWKAKQILVWEETHKQSLLEDASVTFLDGNHENFEPSNLRAINKKENMALNRWRLRTENKDLTEVGLSIAKLRLAIIERSKNEKEQSSVPGSV